MNRLVIIDGNAILHRAFHALPPLTDPDGNIVNAVYGFAAMLLRIVNDLKPTHMAVAFDRPKPTFRKEIFKEYQAKRPKMDDDLIPQVGYVHEMLEAFQIPIFEMDGYEADDCIGTIVSNIKNQKSNIKNEIIEQIIVVTGDRDILQLVEDDQVYVYMPTKGLSEAKLYGEKEVVERLGVKPVQIPDYKALAGDSSDNYPGVEGIGPKTAAQLITDYGSVKNIYRSLEDRKLNNKDNKIKNIKETILKKLEDGKESALLSHNLATIRTDVPIEVDISSLDLPEFDTPQVHAFFEKLHFYSLLKRITKGGDGEGEKEQGEKWKEKSKKENLEDKGQQSLF